jgi:tight adherence protein C
VLVALATIGTQVPTGAAAVVAVAAGCVGAVLPRPALRVDADKRRSEMREVVAVICDLAAVVVAAGEDADGALIEAAGAGQGWAFDEVRRALAATTSRQGAWETLRGLGERLRVDELVTLAQNMGLAAQQGAKVRDALNAQARSLREIVAAEVETKAGGATDSMSLPLALLGIGFMVMIGYPALAKF